MGNRPGLLGCVASAYFILHFAAQGGNFPEFVRVTGNDERNRITELLPAAASDGRTCLIAWKDNRPHGTNRWPTFQGYARVFQINGEQLVGGESLDLQTEPDWGAVRAETPIVTPLGANYLVAWVTPYRHIYGRVVSPETGVQPGLVEVTHTATANSKPGVAANERAGLIVWESRVNEDSDVFGTLLNAQGEFVKLIPIAASEGTERFPTVATLGKDFLVVYGVVTHRQDDNMRAALVTESGEVKPLPEWPNPSFRWDAVRLATSGSKYFVLWESTLNNFGQNSLFGLRVNSRGRPVGKVMTLDENPDGRYWMSLVPTKGRFVCLWFDGEEVHEAAIAPGGGSAATARPMLSPVLNAWQPTIVPAGNQTLVVLTRPTDGYETNGFLTRIEAGLVGKARKRIQ